MDTLIQILKSTYESTSSTIVSVAPKIAVVVIVVALGLLLARVARAALHWVLGLVRFERLAQRIGMTDVLKRAEVSATSTEILGTLVYWTVLVYTALVAMGVLGIATSATFTAIGAMIPNVLIACAILVLGLNVAGFLSKLIQTAVVNAEIRQGRLIRNAAHVGMSALVVILAARQLGVPDTILSTAFLIFFAGTCLAMALAVGLGSREWAGKLAETSWKHEKDQTRALADASKLGTQIFPSTASTSRSKRASSSNKLAA
jgi:hypothetical protein